MYESVGDKYLKISGDSILIDAPYAELYIEDRMMEVTGLVQEGKALKIVGIANMRIFDGHENGKCISGDLVFKLPTVIYTQPTAIERRKMVIKPEVGEIQYVVLKYFKDDLFIVSRSLVKIYENTEIFFKIFNNGKIPSTIPYTMTLQLMLDNLSINSQNLNTPPMIMSLMISESCRSRANRGIPFRKAFNNGDSVHSYVATGFREIARNSSTYTAITFEDFDSMAEASVVKSRYNEEENDSPLEKMIRM